MSKCTYFLGAAVLGLSLSGHVSAQTPSSETSGGQNSNPTSGTSGSTGNFIDLRNDAAYSRLMSGRGSGMIQMGNPLNYRIQAQDGAFGRVSDVVFDRNGNIQYLLGSYQGKTFPLPYSPNVVTATGNVLSYNVPIATLQQLAINQTNLPSLRNQVFAQRMQQVFGATFGSIQSAYPSGMNTQNPASQIGSGIASPFPTTNIGGGTTAGITGTTSSQINGLTSRTNGFGSTGTTAMPTDSWNWPTNPTGTQAGSVTGNISTQPGSLSGGAIGNGTGNNAGFRSNNGAIDNSGFGTSGTNAGAIGQGGTRMGGTIGNMGTTAGAATKGSTAGSGTKGTTAGAGTRGSTKGAGLSSPKPPIGATGSSSGSTGAAGSGS